MTRGREDEKDFDEKTRGREKMTRRRKDEKK